MGALTHADAGTPSPLERASPINVRSFRELLVDAGAEEELELILDLFEKEMFDQLDRLSRAIADEDCAEVANVAHRLKGSSTAVMAKPLAGLLGELERVAIVRNASLFDCQFDHVEDECARLASFLERRRAIMERRRYPIRAMETG